MYNTIPALYKRVFKNQEILKYLDLLDIRTVEDIDTLYNNSIPVNPIKYIDNIGYAVWGQKTTATQMLYMDRINIARLVKYIYKEVNTISHQYLFEPISDKTFSGWKLRVASLLESLNASSSNLGSWPVPTILLL